MYEKITHDEGAEGKTILWSQRPILAIGLRVHCSAAPLTPIGGGFPYPTSIPTAIEDRI